MLRSEHLSQRASCTSSGLACCTGRDDGSANNRPSPSAGGEALTEGAAERLRNTRHR
jgi:hypothetical protein